MFSWLLYTGFVLKIPPEFENKHDSLHIGNSWFLPFKVRTMYCVLNFQRIHQSGLWKAIWKEKKAMILQKARNWSATCKLPYPRFLIPDCGSGLLGKLFLVALMYFTIKAGQRTAVPIDFLKYNYGTMIVHKWNFTLSLQAEHQTKFSLWNGKKKLHLLWSPEER